MTVNKDTATTALNTLAGGGNLAKAGSAFGPWGTAIGLGLDFAGNYLGNRSEQNARNAEFDAYQNYLNKLDQKRAETEGKFKDYYQIGDEQFNKEANTQLPELQQMQEDINNQSTEAQENMSSQMQSQLAQQGVRGGQAATILGRATGNLNKNLNYDQDKLAYDEAQNRQNTRLNYTSQKAMKPYNSLTSAQWLYMPSDTENAMMSNAINKKFGV